MLCLNIATSAKRNGEFSSSLAFGCSAFCEGPLTFVCLGLHEYVHHEMLASTTEVNAAAVKATVRRHADNVIVSPIWKKYHQLNGHVATETNFITI